MQASPFRLWPTLKRANMRAKARTNVRARAAAKERTPARARGVAQPTEPSYLNFSNQAIAARLSGELGPLCGVGVSKSALTQKLKLLALPTDQGRVALDGSWNTIMTINIRRKK
jgi:hypothetical protein